MGTFADYIKSNRGLSNAKSSSIDGGFADYLGQNAPDLLPTEEDKRKRRQEELQKRIEYNQAYEARKAYNDAVAQMEAEQKAQQDFTSRNTMDAVGRAMMRDNDAMIAQQKADTRNNMDAIGRAMMRDWDAERAAKEKQSTLGRWTNDIPDKESVDWNNNYRISKQEAEQKAQQEVLQNKLGSLAGNITAGTSDTDNAPYDMSVVKNSMKPTESDTAKKFFEAYNSPEYGPFTPEGWEAQDPDKEQRLKMDAVGRQMEKDRPTEEQRFKYLDDKLHGRLQEQKDKAYADLQDAKDGMHGMSSTKFMDNALDESNGFLSNDEQIEYANMMLSRQPKDALSAIEDIAKANKTVSESYSYQTSNPALFDNITEEQYAKLKVAWDRLKTLGYSDNEITDLTYYVRTLNNYDEFLKQVEYFKNTDMNPKVQGALSAVLNHEANMLELLSNNATPYHPSMLNAVNLMNENAVNSIDSEFGKKAYEVGYSTFGSLEAAATRYAGDYIAPGLGEVASLAPFFAAGYNSGYDQARAKGASVKQAKESAMMAGAIEVLTEKVSLDYFWDNYSGKLGKDAVINALVGAGIEGSEEAVGDIANRIADKMIYKNDGLSDYQQEVNNYLRQGMTEADAKKQVSKDFWASTGEDFLMGSASGMLMNGVAAVPNISYQNAASDYNKAYDSYIEGKFGANSRYGQNPTQYRADILEEGEAKEQIQKYADKVAQGKKLWAGERADIERLSSESRYNKYAEDIASGESNAMSEKQAREQIIKGIKAGNVDDLRNTFADMISSTDDNVRDNAIEILNEFKGMAEANGIQANLFDTIPEMSGTRTASQRAYTRMFHSGEMGLDFDAVKQAGGYIFEGKTDDELRAIYNKGVQYTIDNKSKEFVKNVLPTYDASKEGKVINEDLAIEDNVDLSAIRITAAVTGLDFEYSRDLGDRVRGDYNSSTGKIKFTKDTAADVFHEVGHFIAAYNREGYNALSKDLITIAQSIGSNFDRQWSAYQAEYSKLKGAQDGKFKVDTEYVNEEITNNLLVAIMNTQEGRDAYVKYLAENYKPDEATRRGGLVSNLFKSIADSIKSIFSTSDDATYKRYDKVSKELSKKADDFVAALDGAIKAYKGQKAIVQTIEQDIKSGEIEATAKQKEAMIKAAEEGKHIPSSMAADVVVPLTSEVKASTDSRIGSNKPNVPDFANKALGTVVANTSMLNENDMLSIKNNINAKIIEQAETADGIDGKYMSMRDMLYNYRAMTDADLVNIASLKDDSEWMGKMDLSEKEFDSMIAEHDSITGDNIMERMDAMVSSNDLLHSLEVNAEQNGEDFDLHLASDGEVQFAEVGDDIVINYSMATLNDTQMKLKEAMEKRGFSEADINAALDQVQSQADALVVIAKEYMEMKEALDAKPITTLMTDMQKSVVAALASKKGTKSEVFTSVLHSFISNGDYPVNIDFMTTCKKRQAYANVMNDLISDGTFENVVFDSYAAAYVNDVLRDAGFETACPGCFVESRRLQIQNWAQNFVKEWNEAVMAVNPNADYFGYSDSDTDAFSISEDELVEMETEYSKYKKNDKGLIKLSGKTVASKMQDLLKKEPGMAKMLTVGDLIKANGLANMRRTDAGKSLFSLVLQRYGTATPKPNQNFNPYQGEVADLSYKFMKDLGTGISGAKTYSNWAWGAINDFTDEQIADLPESMQHTINQLKSINASATKKKDMLKKSDDRVSALALQKYLYDVGGVRLQSFSDFLVENVLDYFQMFADLKAKGLPLHSYSKEISYARIFGMTGAKINMSLIPIVDESVDPENAGLKADGSYAGWGDYETHMALNGTTFIQSIGFKDAVALQLDPRYSPHVGTIAIGISDGHIRKMLNDPLIRMVIPYHASGMTKEFKERTGISMYSDYTDYQNTKIKTVAGDIPSDIIGKGSSKLNIGKCTYVSEANGGVARTVYGDFNFNESLQRHGGDAKLAAREYIDWCNAEHNCKYNGEIVDGNGNTVKAKLSGTAVFAPKFSDSKYGYDFTQEENYYKLLEDFNTYDYDNVTAARQGAIDLVYPDGITAEQEAEYRRRLVESGQFTDAEIEKYVDIAKKPLMDLVRDEAISRNKYRRSADAKYDATYNTIKEGLANKKHHEGVDQDYLDKAYGDGSRSSLDVDSEGNELTVDTRLFSSRNQEYSLSDITDSPDEFLRNVYENLERQSNIGNGNTAVGYVESDEIGYIVVTDNDMYISEIVKVTKSSIADNNDSISGYVDACIDFIGKYSDLSIAGNIKGFHRVEFKPLHHLKITGDGELVIKKRWATTQKAYN